MGRVIGATQVWKKPMAVMVDRYSASASEIFAGAIQGLSKRANYRA